MIDYTSIFETARADFGFENQLDAIASGEAKMLTTVGSVNDDFIVDLEKEANDRGFVTVRADLPMGDVPKEHRQVQLYIIKSSEDFWRIPAYTTIEVAKRKYESNSRVSNFSRVIERLIRGYSDEYIRKLSEFEKMIQVDYGLATVYIVMSIEYEPRLRSLGYRCLDPSTNEDLPRLVIFKGRSVTLKPGAMALVGERHIIARVGVRWYRLLPFLAQISPGNYDSICVDLNEASLREFNGIIETGVELFRNGAWVSQK
jgi:hypothetical protein